MSRDRATSTDDQTVLYPNGPVTSGGLTDRYPEHVRRSVRLVRSDCVDARRGFTRYFLTRRRDKLLFGSDCTDRDGGGPNCLGGQIIAAVNRLAGNRSIERKLLYENAECFGCNAIYFPRERCSRS